MPMDNTKRSIQDPVADELKKLGDTSFNIFTERRRRLNHERNVLAVAQAMTKFRTIESAPDGKINQHKEVFANTPEWFKTGVGHYDELARLAGEGLNAEQQAMYLERAEGLKRQGVSMLAGFQARKHQQIKVDTLKSEHARITEELRSNPNLTVEDFSMSVDDQVDLIKQTNQGQPAEHIISETINDFVIAAVGQLKEQNPDEALKILDKYKGNISSQAHETLNNQIQASILYRKAIEQNPDDLLLAAEYADTSDQPYAVRDYVKSRLRNEYNEIRRREQEQKKENRNNAYQSMFGQLNQGYFNNALFEADKARKEGSITEQEFYHFKNGLESRADGKKVKSNEALKHALLVEVYKGNLNDSFQLVEFSSRLSSADMISLDAQIKKAVGFPQHYNTAITDLEFAFAKKFQGDEAVLELRPLFNSMILEGIQIRELELQKAGEKRHLTYQEVAEIGTSVIEDTLVPKWYDFIPFVDGKKTTPLEIEAEKHTEEKKKKKETPKKELPQLADDPFTGVPDVPSPPQYDPEKIQVVNAPEGKPVPEAILKRVVVKGMVKLNSGAMLVYDPKTETITYYAKDNLLDDN